MMLSKKKKATKQKEELTTVAIYRQDLKELEKMCMKGDLFRDKLGDIITFYKLFEKEQKKEKI